MTKDKNVKVVGGHVRYRRFAYLHKHDRSRFGLLEAVNYQDARNHLGSGYYIRQTWLTSEEEGAIGFDRDRRWKIVSFIFLNRLSSSFIGQ